MKGYKGFNNKLQCVPTRKPFSYEVGKTYTHRGPVKLCSQGFHFCEHPLDTLSYYKPLDDSRYAEVDADGVSDQTENDSKRVAQSLTIKAEVKIPALIKAAVEFVFQKVKATTGDSAHSATTGNSAQSSVAGEQCIAASLGVAGQAKGIKGNWIVLAEWDDGKIKAMGIARIDGKKIKSDTFYTLKGGKFVEVK